MKSEEEIRTKLKELEKSLSAYREGVSLGVAVMSREEVLMHKGAVKVLKEILGEG